MWIKPILTATAVLAGTSLSAEGFARPFVTQPTLIAMQAMALAEGADGVTEGQEPEFKAAVLALLLVSELGLAEAFEEAVAGGDDDEHEEDGEAGDPYGRAYDLLQSVHRLIVSLPGVGENAEVVDLLGRLDALMPTPERPARLDADPEAAEVIAQALVGVLERELRTELYLGRDLGTALQTIAHMVAHACNARGFDHEAGSLVSAAAFYFEETLEAPLSVMMPEAGETIEEALDRLEDSQSVDLDACFDLSLAFDDVAQLFPGVGQ